MSDRREPTEPAGSAALSAATRGMWTRFREPMLARVTTLENAALSLLDGELSDELRRDAIRDAHRLAGSVGMFGFAAASRLAREAEQILTGTAAIEQADVLRLSDLLVSIRGELEAPAATEGAAPRATADSERVVWLISRETDRVESVATQLAGRGYGTRTFTHPEVAHGSSGRERAAAVLLVMDDASAEHAGWSLADAFRRAEPPIPVVVLDEKGRLDHRKQAARTGVRAFLAGTLAARTIVAALEDAAESRSIAGSRILLLARGSGSAAENALSAAGATVATIFDPDDLWPRIRTTLPDLLIVEVEAAADERLELCRMVRADPRWQTIPILILTGIGEVRALRIALDAGADDFVPTPVAPTDLVNGVSAFLARTRARQRSSSTDPLTGTLTRPLFLQAAERLLRLSTAREEPFSVSILSPEGLDDPADSAVTDELMRSVAGRLEAGLAPGDTLGRWSGDSFAIAMHGVTKEVATERLRQRLQRIGEEGFALADGSRIGPRFSAGTASYPKDGSELESLTHAAEETLRAAIAAGDARVVAAGWSPDGRAMRSVDVLIVEDDPIVAELLRHALDARGASHEWIRDGNRAVEALIGDSATLTTRVVLLDVDLPGMDGNAILRALQRAHLLKSTRVIMVTARAHESEILSTLEAGAFDHVGKPFSIPILLQRVQRALAN